MGKKLSSVSLINDFPYSACLNRRSDSLKTQSIYHHGYTAGRPKEDFSLNYNVEISLSLSPYNAAILSQKIKEIQFNLNGA
jgi:hypothetical protein